MRPIAILAMLLAGAACAPVNPPIAGTPAAGQPGAAATPAACETTTVPVTVGGRPEQAAIEACPQPDGSWRITQTTPGLPPQVYSLPPPPVAPYPAVYSYPDSFPYWGGAPWFFGLAPSIVVVQRFNHFHHGFGHGFAHGFGRGFGHGFAGVRGGGMAGGHR